MTAGSAPRVIKQSRPGVIVLIALVVELVAILSLANQVVAKHLTTYGRHHPFAFPGRLALAATIYRWQVNAQPGDRANELLAHLCLDLVVLVLTALLVYVLTRGSVTFLRAFFGTWLTVIVATMLGSIVFAVVSPPPYPPHLKHVTGAVFYVPSGFGLVAGVVLGFVTALFAAIFAVATRRIIRLAPAYDPDAAGGAYREDQPDWSDQTMAYPRSEYGGGYGSGPGYRSGPGYGGGAGYAGAAAGGYYASQVGEGGERSQPPAQPAPDATQSLRPVADETQAMAPPTGAQPVAEQPGAAEPTVTEPPAEPLAANEAAEPAPGEAGADPAETQQFPRPPDDEDLGQHPEHDDL